MITNLINFNVSRFDNKNKNSYNYSYNRNTSFQSYRKILMTDLNSQDIVVKKINSLKNIEKSPVAYLKPLIEKYINNQVTTKEFISSFNKETGFAKYCLSKLSNNDINEIKNLFKEELNFADKLNALIMNIGNKDIPKQDILKKISEI